MQNLKGIAFRRFLQIGAVVIFWALVVTLTNGVVKLETTSLEHCQELREYVATTKDYKESECAIMGILSQTVKHK